MNNRVTKYSYSSMSDIKNLIDFDTFDRIELLKAINKFRFLLSEKCPSFTTTHLYTNMKPNLSNVVIFILIEQNGLYVIRQNNIKGKMFCFHYFLIKRKKLFGRANIL